MSSVSVAATVDVPCNWRRLTCWRKSEKNFPDVGMLRAGVPCLVDHTNVLLTEIEDVIEVRDWLKGNTRAKFELLGRFSYQAFPFRVERDLLGVNFKFDDADEAFFFKMRWF